MRTAQEAGQRDHRSTISGYKSMKYYWVQLMFVYSQHFTIKPNWTWGHTTLLQGSTSFRSLFGCALMPCFSHLRKEAPFKLQQSSHCLLAEGYKRIVFWTKFVSQNYKHALNTGKKSVGSTAMFELGPFMPPKKQYSTDLCQRSCAYPQLYPMIGG